MSHEKGSATDLIHRGEQVTGTAVPLTMPIYETTTYLFDSAEDVRRCAEGKSDKYFYTRYGNPTVVSAEEKIAALDHAERGLLFSSGQAATATTLMGLLKAGDEIVCGAAIYGGTLHLLADLLVNFGLKTRFVSLEDLQQPERVIGPGTRLVWFESPINPTLRCIDIRRVAAACRATGVLSVIDNTFATPLNQQPLAMGIDLAMQAATKYLNGHSDVTAGTIAGPAALIGRIETARRLLGTILDPFPAYLLARGMKTMPLRMARHNENALAVARFFEQDRRVSRVYYPGLSSHPDHEVARSQMRGFGGMVCFDLGGDYERAARCFDRLTLVKRAASLGGVESLMSLPVLTSQWGHTPEQLCEAGITAGMCRVSVGLEDADDLIRDLDQALA